ncbi:MAG: hypothetical protein ACK4XK_01620 [Casimicrobiaceae bacterium]
MPYQKTTAGLNEIQSRQLGLRAELRRLLIMVDGKSPLAKFAPAFPTADVEALARELAALGLIADAQAQGATSGVAAAAPAPAPAASAPTGTVTGHAPAEFGRPTVTQFNAARRAAVRFINDHLGPPGETLALRLERAADPDELRAAVKDARALLERFMGAATGQRFIEHVRSAAANVV